MKRLITIIEKDQVKILEPWRDVEMHVYTEWTLPEYCTGMIYAYRTELPLPRNWLG